MAKTRNQPRKMSMQPDGNEAGRNPVQVRSLTVQVGRLICDVRIADARHRYTTPELVELAIEHYPDLPYHACVNAKGPSFGEVIDSTSTVHLLEHIAISEQVRATAFPSAEFIGTSEWVDEAAGLGRIEISFLDDLEALRAFAEATRFLNIAVLTCFA